MKPAFDPLFGAIAGDGWFPSPTHLLRRAALLHLFRAYPAGRLLEMGCGAGRFLVDWHSLGHRGEAVDLDREARRLAKDCAKAFDAGFAVRERPQGRNYDYLVTTEVLEHLENPAEMLSEWARYLRPGGILLCTVPAFARLWSKSDEWAGHVQRFEPNAFRKLVADAGFDVIEARLYGFPLGNLLRLVGNFTSAQKMRQRATELTREEATLASGRDRSVEHKLAPVMQSLPARVMLKLAIVMQSLVNLGPGLIVVARKHAEVPRGKQA